MELDEETKNRLEALAVIIVSALKENSSVFMNIQIEEEYSQYDVLFAYDFANYGIHQRGIKANDLLISIVGGGCHGFSVSTLGTDPGYYTEKLRIHSNFLSLLFNEVRKRLKEGQ